MEDITMTETRRQGYERTRAALELDRSSFFPDWRDIGDYIVPMRPQFNLTDTNRGGRRNQKIIDSTASLAHRTLVAGMSSGITSPARPWFGLTTPDPDLSELGSVKEWLHTVNTRMRSVFSRSNVYNMFPILYGDIGAFGTGALFIEEDYDNVFRAFVMPIGSYCIGLDDKLRVGLFTREFRLTIRQCVQRFAKKGEGGTIDWSNFSESLKSKYLSGSRESWVDIVHIVQANPNHNPDKLTAKKFQSVYYEKNAPAGADIFLRDSGYDHFPVLAPRWAVTGENVWATSSPGYEVIGDVKGLQVKQKRRAQAIEKQINPPMVGPTTMKNARVSLLPGDFTLLDERDGMKGFRPAHDTNIRLADLMLDIQEFQARIQRGFYEDLFLMLAQTDRRQITAREVDERHEEKLLVLGPVLEQLNQDLLDPLIDIVFDFMVKQGYIPEAPEELQGVKLQVDYVSIMAAAQKSVGMGAIERFAGFVGSMAAVDPAVLDKIDRDQIVDEYGNMVGIPPRLIVPDDKVFEIRAERAKQQAAQQQALMMQNSAKAVKDLSGADTGGQNALTDMMNAQTGG